jgi:hypothetical protein
MRRILLSSKMCSDPVAFLALVRTACGLMRCHAKAEDVNGVRKVYKVLAESLRKELDDEKAEPLPETTSLLRELTGSK